MDKFSFAISLCFPQGNYISLIFDSWFHLSIIAKVSFFQLGSFFGKSIIVPMARYQQRILHFGNRNFQ